tara:strand:+ start:3848 stop:4444 length:597 start_codon:yes stop_codon:yes gene_type:complete
MWFKKQKQQPAKEPIKRERVLEVIKVYQDKLGNEWFEYANPMQLPAKRAIAGEVATRFAEMNLTKESLITLMAEMKKKANEGNIVDLFQLLAEIEFRLNFLGEETTLLELACCYYLINNEDETDFSDLYRTKKLEVFKVDEEAKAFFIQGAFRYTIKYSQLSETDIQDYLKQNVPNEERLNLILQTLKSQDTSKTSTT